MGCACKVINEDTPITFKEDPTKTIGIRKRWISQYSKRYRALKGRINRLLLTGDEGGIPVPLVNSLIVNKFVFTSDAQSVAEFMAWLELQVDQLLYTNDATATTIWQNKFIDQSYVRGVNRSKALMAKTGVTAEILQGALPAAITGTATPTFGLGVGSALGTISSPIHLDAIHLLYVREFDALKGITNEMSKQIGRVLVEGVEQGLGIKDIARSINNRVDKIGLTRSKLLARTESARAYNIGTINEVKVVANTLGVEAQYEWQTAGDGSVRPVHRERNGKIYSASEAFALIGEPNCRCAIIPHFDPEILKAAA